jgi:hypothetical protein
VKISALSPDGTLSRYSQQEKAMLPEIEDMHGVRASARRPKSSDEDAC